MKFFILLLILFCFNTHGNAQNKLQQCNVKLLSRQTCTTECGLIKFCEKMKFKLIIKQKKCGEADTVIFYVLCPGDYENNFWVLNNNYHVGFSREMSLVKNATIITHLSKKDKKYKIIGIIKEARKLENSVTD